MKEPQIIDSVEELKDEILRLNTILDDLHKMGVEIIFQIKHPYETKQGVQIEIQKITQTVDYLKDE